jgi:hypothetical protein
MKLELKNLNKNRRENAIAFFQFAANNPCPNRLFIQNNSGDITSIKKVISLENERVKKNDIKIELICKELSISPKLISNRMSLMNRLIFNENTLSDFIVIALEESKIFRRNLFKLIDKKKLSNIYNSDIIREKSLWDKNDIQSSGRADIQIDIYENLKCSILIEHKIYHTLSGKQIKKYCHSGKKTTNSYFILLSSKDCDIKVLEENNNVLLNNFNHPPLWLTHYSILKILVQTMKEEKRFAHKHLLPWLFEIVYNFKNENVINNELKKYNKFLTKSNFTLTTLESCYG